jgi:adenylate cyclase
VEEDRRLVTVLFCDLVGFTPLSERLDAEQIWEIQDAYFRAMSEEIRRFGGIVQKYAGDAVLAIFGVPTVHEDDPERAVRCALAMQGALIPVAADVLRRWGAHLAMRIGVNSGEVVSGRRTVEGRADHDVTGDTVNTAARFQTAAEPGGIVVGEETMHLARHGIVFGPRRDLALKGKAAPVPAYPVIGLRERAAERWEAAGGATPLVGRQKELDALLAARERARAGEGSIVSVVADAGVGKSRLLNEALARLQGVRRIVRGRCFSYSQAGSLSLITDLVRDVCTARATEPGADAAAVAGVQMRIQRAVEDLVPASAARAEVTEILHDVLGLPIRDPNPAYNDPQVRQRALIRGLAALLAGLSARGASVIVLEDLHWLDTASEAVLAEVLPQVRRCRLLVLTTQRPEHGPAWSAQDWATRLELYPLAETEAGALARAVLGGVTLGDDLERRINDRAEGNPFFVEELLRSLREAGELEERDGVMHLSSGAEQRLPSTLTEVLLARLDRLERDVRSLAQVGAVIGRTFAVRLLARVAGADVQTLEAPLAALHRAMIAAPRAGAELEYAFKHVAIRDVAYNSLLLRRRRTLHRAIAGTLVELQAGEEAVDLIAYHYARSDEAIRVVAGWLERAGDRAAGVYANEAALTNYEEARRRIEKSTGDDINTARLDVKLGGVLRTLGRYGEALEALERAAAFYESAGDHDELGTTVAMIGDVHITRGSLGEGITRMQPVLETLEREGTPTAALVKLRIMLARAKAVQGEGNEALVQAARAVREARAIEHHHLLAQADILFAGRLRRLSRMDEALAIAREALALAEESGELRLLSEALGLEIVIHEEAGDLDACRALCSRALEIAERIGDPAEVAEALQDRGRIAYRLGDWTTARADMERGTALVRSTGKTPALAFTLYALGAVAVFQGDFEVGFGCLEESIAIAGNLGLPSILIWSGRFMAEGEILAGRAGQARDRLEGLLAGLTAEQAYLTLWTLPAMAWAYAEVGDLERARETADRAVREASALGDRVVLPDALWVAGIVATRLKRWTRAEELFREGLELSRSIAAIWPEGRTLYYLGLLLIERGDTVNARARLGEALSIFHRLGAKPYIARVEQALQTLGKKES